MKSYVDEDGPLDDPYAEKLKGEIRAEYFQQENLKKFRTDFYRAWPSLRAHEEVAAATMQKMLNDVMDLGYSEAIDAIGEAAMDRVKQIERSQHADQEASIIVGGPGHEDEVAPHTPAPTVTLGDHLRERKRKREIAEQAWLKKGGGKDAA